jgi:hypothetical protein
MLKQRLLRIDRDVRRTAAEVGALRDEAVRPSPARYSAHIRSRRVESLA